jgi:hypothetical protein
MIIVICTGSRVVDVSSLGLEDARALAAELSATLTAREIQLERKFEEVASMQELTQQLMVSHASEISRRHAASHDGARLYG